MPPKEKGGTLSKQLDEYLALSKSLTNKKKLQQTRISLLNAACKRIDRCNGKLSDEEIKTLKNAMNKFVDRENKILAGRVMQALDESKWGALRIELVSFSRTKYEHMRRMSIKFPRRTPHRRVVQAVDRLDRMYQLDVALPPHILVDFFIRIFYPIINPRRPSEPMARGKIAGYFHLLDTVNPDNCWVLLDELPLFDLSATSMPSEVKTVDGNNPPLEDSTFLTGRADLAIITLTGKSAPVMKDEVMKKKLIKSLDGSFTYKTILDRVRRLEITRDGASVKVEGVQFLVIEAKTNLEVGGADTKSRGAGDSGSSVDDEGSADEEGLMHEGDPTTGMGNEEGEDRFVDETKERPKYTGEEATREMEDNSKNGESKGDKDNKRGRGKETNKREELSEESGEGEDGKGEDEDFLNQEVDDVDDAGEGPLGLILRKSLPQIFSESAALAPSRDEVTKFILSDGDNWIFGVLDCTKGERGQAWDGKPSPRNHTIAYFLGHHSWHATKKIVCERTIEKPWDKNTDGFI